MKTKVFALILLCMVVLASSQNKPCNYKEANFQGGHGWIQIGKNWRIGIVPNTKIFVFSHRSGYTPTYYNMWGNFYADNYGKGVYTLWPNSYDEPGEITGVEFGNDYIEFLGIFKLGETISDFLSISTIAFKTALIWTPDGGRIGGVREDYNGYWPESNCKSGPSTIKFGKNGSFIEINRWRLGEYDDIFFSIGRVSITAQLIRSDGYLWGKRSDYNLFHREICVTTPPIKKLDQKKP